MKRIHLVLAALALLALTVGLAHAETYVEAYFGNTFGITSPDPLKFDLNPNYRGPSTTDLEFPRTYMTAFIFGAKVGTWFSREGFPRLSYPDWMKYLGFYLDFSHHGFEKSNLTFNKLGSRRIYVSPSNYPHYQHYKFWADEASITTIAFMFAVRYGFNPTKKVPFGKIQPYAAVGPALFITSLKPTFVVQPQSTAFLLFPTLSHDYTELPGPFMFSVNIGLETELGLRFMFTRENGPKDRAISLDTSFKYRLVQPSFSYDMNIAGYTHQLKFSPQINLFSLQAGIAYHF